MPELAPFGGLHYVLKPGGGGEPEISLKLATSADAEMLGPELAVMQPWARLGTSSEQMISFLSASDGNKRSFTIWHGGDRAGVIVLRFPWLAGPYLNLLGILSTYQRGGLGHMALAWLEAEALAGGARNSFLCVSAFNARAHAFYRRNGYVDVAELGDLIKAGENEILMRKRLR